MTANVIFNIKTYYNSNQIRAAPLGRDIKNARNYNKYFILKLFTTCRSL